MEVVCRFTNEKVNKDKAFSIVLEGAKKKSYFKSEEVYKIWLIEEVAEELIRKKLNSILCVDEYKAYNVGFKAKMKMWKKNYKLVEILFTIERFEKELKSNFDKGINYLSAIIDNNLYVGVGILKSKIDIKYEKVSSEMCEKSEKLLNSSKFLGNRMDISNL